MNKCKECKGTGYVTLLTSREPCKACTPVFIEPSEAARSIADYVRAAWKPGTWDAVPSSDDTIVMPATVTITATANGVGRYAAILREDNTAPA
jgi:hypothetical protein